MMKKLIIPVIIILSISSCKKEGNITYCWVCNNYNNTQSDTVCDKDVRDAFVSSKIILFGINLSKDVRICYKK